MLVVKTIVNEQDILRLRQLGKNMNKTLVERMVRAEQRLQESLRMTANAMTRSRDKGYNYESIPRLVQTVIAGGKPEITNESNWIVEVRGKVGANRPYAYVRNIDWTVKPTTVSKVTVPFSGVPYFEPLKSLRAKGLTFVRKNIIFLKVLAAKSARIKGRSKLKGGTFHMGLQRGGAASRVIPIYTLRASVFQSKSEWIDKGVEQATPDVLRILAGDM